MFCLFLDLQASINFGDVVFETVSEGPSIQLNEGRDKDAKTPALSLLGFDLEQSCSTFYAYLNSLS